MGKSSNVIIVAISCILFAGVLLLVLLSCSCSPRSGGGASGTTSAQVQQTDNTATESATNNPSQAEEDALNQLEQKIAEMEGARPVGQNVRDVASSIGTQNDASVCREFEARGFDINQVLTNSNMDGTTIDPTAVSKDSTEAHPSYIYVYTSTNGTTWIVYVNDGKYSAVPRAYNSSDALQKQIILSENDTVTQYDSINNTYSDFSLTELEGVLGIRVDRIDTRLLDSYTVEQLEVL